MPKKQQKEEEKNYLSERHIIKNPEWINILDELCFKAKNLYNVIMYLIKQCNAYQFGSTHESVLSVIKELNAHIDEFNKNSTSKDIAHITKENWDIIKYKNFIKWYMNHIYESEGYEQPFKSLEASTAGNVIDLVFRDWTSFFAEIKDWKNNPHKYNGKPNPPTYKHKEKGRVEIRTKYRAVKKGGRVDLYRNCPIFVKTKLPIKKVQQMQARPIGRYYEITLVYKNPNIKPPVAKNNRIIGIDLGIDRFATIQNNFGEEAIAINGKGIKSINKKYNKDLAHYKSIAMKVNGVHSTKRIQNLHYKRNMRMNNFIHNASRFIVNYCIEHNVDTVVIGKNNGWKQKSKMNKKTNQDFIQLPHANFIKKLKYKLNNEGIELIETEESYTSKASFIDNDDIPVYSKEGDVKLKFSGKRFGEHDKLYKSANGIIVHADVNGASNIIRKKFEFKWNENVSMHPRIVNVI